MMECFQSQLLACQSQMQNIQSTLQNLRRGLSTSISPRKKVKHEHAAFATGEIIDLTWMDEQSGRGS